MAHFYANRRCLAEQFGARDSPVCVPRILRILRILRIYIKKILITSFARSQVARQSVIRAVDFSFKMKLLELIKATEQTRSIFRLSAFAAKIGQNSRDCRRTSSPADPGCATGS